MGVSPHVFLIVVLWQENKNKATASLTTPSKTHLFLHSCRLDLWELPRFWTSGLKPLYSFFRLFARRGNINQFFAGICMVLWSHFFFQEVFRAKAPSRVHRLTRLLCLHMKLFTCCKTCLHIRLSFKTLVRIWVGTNFFSNFQKPSSSWVPVKSRWDPTLLVTCILLCDTELNFNLCTRAWLLHARLRSACTRVWALFTAAWKNLCVAHPAHFQWEDANQALASRMCASSKNVNIPTPPHPMTGHRRSMASQKTIKREGSLMVPLAKTTPKEMLAENLVVGEVYPIGSMYGIFTYMTGLKTMVNQ